MFGNKNNTEGGKKIYFQTCFIRMSETKNTFFGKLNIFWPSIMVLFPNKQEITNTYAGKTIFQCLFFRFCKTANSNRFRETDRNHLYLTHEMYSLFIFSEHNCLLWLDNSSNVYICYCFHFSDLKSKSTWPPCQHWRSGN